MFLDKSIESLKSQHKEHFYTFKTIAFLKALSHMLHWWLLSPWTLRMWLPKECLFCSTLLQIGQLAKVSWCRDKCFRKLSSCFNLKIIFLYLLFMFEIPFLYLPSTTNIALHFRSDCCRMFLHMILKYEFTFEHTGTDVTDVCESKFVYSSNVRS